jgi:AraC-like DNA-binding protein
VVEVDFTRPVTPAAGRHWSQTIQYVEGLVSNGSLLATAPLARRELGWLINSAILACFPNSTLDAETSTYAGDTPLPLRRALSFIDEHASDSITLSEIARAARLSPRGLQAAFRRHLDTTPLGYLRSVRMEWAHRELQSADQSEGSVWRQWLPNGDSPISAALPSNTGVDSGPLPVRRCEGESHPEA